MAGEHKWEWRAGYDYASEKFKAEIESLKKEVAELKAQLNDKQTKSISHQVKD